MMLSEVPLCRLFLTEDAAVQGVLAAGEIFAPGHFSTLALELKCFLHVLFLCPSQTETVKAGHRSCTAFRASAFLVSCGKEEPWMHRRRDGQDICSPCKRQRSRQGRHLPRVWLALALPQSSALFHPLCAFLCPGL